MDETLKVMSRVFTTYWYWFLALVTIFRLCVSFYYPIVPDEAYYLLWTVKLQLSYIDHPAMVAILGYPGHLFGSHFFRILSPIAGLISAIAIREVCLIFIQGQESKPELKANSVSILWSVLPGNSVLFTTLTPDTALVVFISLVFWSFAALIHSLDNKRNTLLQVLILFALTGAACESKYSAILFVAPCLLIITVKLIQNNKYRELIMGCVVFALCMLPATIWNYQHEYIGWLKQTKRFDSVNLSKALGYLLELIGGQLLWVTPPVFVAIFFGIHKADKRQRNILLSLIVPSLVVFLLHTLNERVQANWVSYLYVPCLVFLCFLSVRVLKIMGVFAAACSALFYLQVLVGILPLSAHNDPALRMGVGWSGLAKGLVKTYPGQSFVFSDYALASILRNEISSGAKVYSTDYRWKWLSSAHSIRAVSGMLVTPVPIEELRKDSKIHFVCRYRKGQLLNNLDQAVRCYRLTSVKNIDSYLIP